jgi:hypothetical protein
LPREFVSAFNDSYNEALERPSPKIATVLADLKRLAAAKHKVVIVSPEQSDTDLTGLLDLIGESLQTVLGIEEYGCGQQLAAAGKFYVRAGKRGKHVYSGKTIAGQSLYRVRGRL